MSATKLSTETAMGNVVEADGVAIERGGRLLFQNVNFRLPYGRVLLLTGPNGCGKTSLLRAIAGALPVAAGRLHRDGQAPAAFMPADDAVWQGDDSIVGALSFWARLSGGDVDHALAATGLTALRQRSLSRLSTGQKRRLSLARVLAQPAVLWLLDEPMVGLDGAGRAALADVLQHHVQAGGAAVIASHETLPTALDVYIDRFDLLVAS